MRNKLNLKRSDIVNVALLKTSNVANGYVGTSAKLVEFLNIECNIDIHQSKKDEKLAGEIVLITSTEFINFIDCTHFKFNHLTYKLTYVENLGNCVRFKGVLNL